ncbi:MAG: hypothetical protein AAGG09_15220 [Pseudomonadota bacterium]
MAEIPADAAPAIRYRGLRFPHDGAVLPTTVRLELRAGSWQPDYTAAALAVATTMDRAVIFGAGTGHLAAVLSGKLGLPHVTVVEARPEVRAYLARLARDNGLHRLTVLAEADIASLDPTLICVDLDAATLPQGLDQCGALRALVLHVPTNPGAETLPFPAIANAGLAYSPAESAGQGLVFARPITAP